MDEVEAKPTSRRAVRERVRAIAVALDLPNPEREVEAALASDEATIRWAKTHRQSLEWILLGDPRWMVRALRRGTAACP